MYVKYTFLFPSSAMLLMRCKNMGKRVVLYSTCTSHGFPDDGLTTTTGLRPTLEELQATPPSPTLPPAVLISTEGSSHESFPASYVGFAQ